MISDWELWACAQQIVQQYGAEAKAHAARRTAELAQAGDEEGVRTWRAISDRVDQLGDYRGKKRAWH